MYYQYTLSDFNARLRKGRTMKISICDICKGEGKIVNSTHRISYKSKAEFKRIALDTCKEHSRTFKTKTYTQAEKLVDDLYANPKYFELARA